MPSTGELRTIGEGLIRYWPGARDRLRLYSGGRQPWSMAHRDIKILLRELSDAVRASSATKVPLHFREKALVFAATYGTDTRVVAEPLTARIQVRFTAADIDAISAAAKADGVDVTSFIRAASVLAAQRTTEGTT